MSHLTMFKKSSNEAGMVRCVISDEFVEEFTAMGFVNHVDKLDKKQAPKPKSKKVATDDSNEG